MSENSLLKIKKEFENVYPLLGHSGGEWYYLVDKIVCVGDVLGWSHLDKFDKDQTIVVQA